MEQKVPLRQRIQRCSINTLIDLFENLFDRRPQYYEDASTLIDQLPIQELFAEEPDDEEILKACQSLKEKAPGDSGLLPQF